VVGLVALFFLGIPIRLDNNHELQKKELFRDFLQRFNKTYDGNETEYMKHYINFKVWEYVAFNRLFMCMYYTVHVECH
jgi:hypothetical protein